MGRVSIQSNNGKDATSVPNCFIDKYMVEANEAQVKIYLFLLRMMSSDIPTSVPALADVFNYTEADVHRALKYWDKRGLISLEFDAMHNLTGIHIEDLLSEPLLQTKSSRYLEAVETIKSPTTLSHKRCNSEVEGIIYVAEQYIGRPLTTVEMTTIYYIHDDLSFSGELLDYLIQYCVEKDKKNFKYIQKVAMNWNQRGIKTLEQARKEVSRHNNEVITVMKALGISSTPTDKEITFISEWRDDLGFSLEIILEACDRTVISTERGRLRYCDGILRKWRSQKVITKSDIERLDAEHTKAYKKNAPFLQNTNNNKRSQMEHNPVDFAELERVLIEN